MVKTMRIGILQTGDAPVELKHQFGEYSDMFVALLSVHKHDFSFKVYPVLHNEFPADANECDGWLITGSRYSAYEGQPWIHELKEFVRQIAATDKPLVGICFGHQIIAEALGGRVEKSDKGWGLGLDTYTLSDDAPESVPQALTLNVFHQDQIVKLPPNTRIFASSDFCQYAGMLIGDKIMTIQAHPEFLNEFNCQLLQARKNNVVPENLANEAIIRLQKHNAKADSNLFAKWIRDFLTRTN